jgi:hypothetical protein
MTLLHEKPKFLNFADGKLNNADKILTHASHVFYGTFASEYSQANVAALDFVACQSKKAANIHNRW